MVGRRPGRARRRAGFAVTAAAAVLVTIAVYGIAAPGEVGHRLVAAFTALPTGLLLALAALDLLTPSTPKVLRRWPAASIGAWMETDQGRRQAAKAAFN